MLDGELIREALTASYGLRVTAVVQMKSVYGVVCAGEHRTPGFVWKFASGSDTAARLEALAPVLAKLRRGGIAAAGPLRNRSGDLLTTLPDGRQGYLQPWLRGRHADYADRSQRLAVLRTVGRVHRLTAAAITAVPAALCTPHPLARKLMWKRETLQRVWPDLAAHCPQAIADQVALFAAADAACQALARAAPAVAFCHRDLAPHNVLCRGTALAPALIDFDLAAFDDPLTDLVQVVNHFVFLGRPAPGDLREMVDVYRQAAGGNGYRKEVLWALLGFPDLLVRAAAEWVKAGCPPARRWRVVAVLQKERARRRVWATDRPPGLVQPFAPLRSVPSEIY